MPTTLTPEQMPVAKEVLEKLKRYGFDKVEMMQKGRLGGPEPTTFPEPEWNRRLTIVLESETISMEHHYHWIIHQMRYDQEFPYMIKIMDIFAASEHSSFWGAAQQRLQLQQSQISNYLGVIGKMIKELFQLVRELRVLDEKLKYYTKSLEGDHAAEIALKGSWVDLVEGGTKNTASVYGMAAQVGFATLPDLFFAVHPRTHAEVNSMVDALKFNNKIKEVLKRKLFSFVTWRESTHDEMKNRRKFTVRYLRQHFDIINMYMGWIKPYLRNVRRLTLAEDHINSVDLIGTFEGNVTEVEMLCHKPEKEGWNLCVLMNFHMKSQPQMNFNKDGYQHRGPHHSGRLELVWRPYLWTSKQIENYVAYRRDENLDMIASIDESLQAAMEALGEDLRNYLKEAGENVGHPELAAIEKKKPVEASIAKGIFDPFLSMFRAPGPKGKKVKTETSKTKYKKDLARRKLLKPLFVHTFQCYKNFKKHNGLLSW